MSQQPSGRAPTCFHTFELFVMQFVSIKVFLCTALYRI